MAVDAVSTKMVGLLSGFLGTAVGLTMSYFTAISDLQVLKEQVKHLNDKIAMQMDDRWRGADARLSHSMIDERDAAMMKAIEANARHIDELQEILREHAADRKLHQ